MSPRKERYSTEAEQLLGVSRDELAEILRSSHRAVIVEADEWRPLAGHVLELVQLALTRAKKEK